MSDTFKDAVRTFLRPPDQASIDQIRSLFSEVNAGEVGPFACVCNPDCLCARQCEEGDQQNDEAP